MRYQRSSDAVLSFAAAATGLAFLVGCSGGDTGHPAPPPPSARPSSSAVPLAGQSAARILAAATRATRAAGSVHVAVTAVSGSKTLTFSDDVSATASREVITTYGGGRALFLLIAGVGYLQGNAAALENYYEFPATLATQVSGRWISFHHDDQAYQALTIPLTFTGVVDQISLLPPLARQAPSLVAGQPAVSVRGTAPAATGASGGTNATLYIAATGRPLPLSLHSDGSGKQVNVRFSNWGEEAVHLAPPSDAIPVSSLQN